jgi:SAM-dependent methyltransferase
VPALASLPPPARFDRAAPRYAAGSPAQAAVAQALADLAARRLPAPHRVWEIGCGTGALTRALAPRWPGAEWIAQDASVGMLMAAAAAGTPPGVRWWRDDARQGPPAPRVDAVVSASALHWLGPPARALSASLAPLRPGGALAAAVMIAGTLREIRQGCTRLRPDLPFPELPDAGEWLAALAPLAQLDFAHVTEWAVPHPDPRSALRALRDQGVNAPPFQPAHPLPVTALRRVFASLHATTYRVLLLVARKL